jgi:hypothetical protein
VQGSADLGCETRYRRYARLAACYGVAFHVLAYYEEDSGHEAHVNIDAGGDGCRIELLDERGCVVESLEAAERALPKLLGATLVRHEATCSEADAGREGLRYRGIVGRLLEEARAGILDCLRREAISSRLEFFYVAGLNGEYATGYGGEYSITLPRVPGVVFAHTHPGGLCYPSARDARSAADFLASGGLAELIVSPSCSFALFLEEPLSEEDYWRLQEVYECLNRARSGEEYSACLSTLSRLRSLAASLL